MATLGLGEEEAGVRLSLERSIYDACKRSPEGSDFLVSAFVQALHSYRRSSGRFRCEVRVLLRVNGFSCGGGRRSFSVWPFYFVAHYSD